MERGTGKRLKVMQNKTLLYAFMALTLIFSGCEKSETSIKSATDIHKPLSWGKSKVIFVSADKKVWEYGKLEILKSLEREFFTTKNEKLFTVQLENINDIKKYYKFANLLFFCSANSTNPTSQYVKEILPDKVASLSDSMPANIFLVKDLWSQNQTVVFVIGKDIESLLLYTFRKSNVIFNIFRESELERIKSLVYRPGLNKKEIEYQKQHYPWHLNLPNQYIPFRRDDENHFVSYLLRVKKYPDRYLAIYWEEMPENSRNGIPIKSGKIDKEWLWKKRLELGKKYYEGDEFSSEDVTQEKTQFLSYNGYKLSGRWQNPDYFVGGAFVSFAFYDEEQKIAYLIDNSVFFPEGEKLRALMGLEIISKTFKTN